MDFLEEFLLTALISVLLAFLFGSFSADRPEAASAAAEDFGPRPRALNPIQAEEMEGKSSVIALGESSCTDAEVEEERSDANGLEKDGVVVGFDRKNEEFFDGVVGNGRIEDDLEEPGEAKSAEQVAELGGELVGNKEEAGHVDEGNWKSLLQGEDEWEGIERSDTEKLFRTASEFVGSDVGGEAVSKLSNEVQMQLYGLHKVATEGPCNEPQPLVLMMSARAKWHSWQQLGNMNPEAAMEQYINLLTESIPEWMVETSKVEDKGHDANDPPAADVLKIGHVESKSSQSKSETEIVENSSSAAVTENLEAGSQLLKQGLANMLLFTLISPTRVAF
ncbi:acyl-CoA-binding domain-containing protein 3-like [Zingiber officinale]|uniref:acyl-CoA-binding domain-containing protein 3-like n=1 Tax=Zingiber officinale TaxID=94328 RepID=UPI001C4C3D3B|nr:acyl-CoA-binding domain-containing protein 3-like [Zingiber officinale]